MKILCPFLIIFLVLCVVILAVIRQKPHRDSRDELERLIEIAKHPHKEE